MKLIDGGSLAEVIQQRECLAANSQASVPPPPTTRRESAEATPGLADASLPTANPANISSTRQPVDPQTMAAATAVQGD